jgi:hypothetical protein
MVQLGDGPPSFTKVLFVHQGCGGLQSWTNDVCRRSSMLEFDTPSRTIYAFPSKLGMHTQQGVL